MMRHLLISSALLAPSTAFAHAGHIGELAGHDHVVIGVTLGGLLLAGLLAGAKAKGKSEEKTTDEPDAESGEPA